MQQEQQSYFTPHPFDKCLPETYTQRKRKSWVTSGLSPLTGVAPIRERFFKLDESRIDDLTRMGMTAAEAETILELVQNDLD